MIKGKSVPNNVVLNTKNTESNKELKKNTGWSRLDYLENKFCLVRALFGLNSTVTNNNRKDILDNI